MSKEIQKDEYYLPGDLGTVNGGKITEAFIGKDGATTLTITPIIDEMKPLKDYLQGKSSTGEFIQECRQIYSTEDAEFEVIEPQQIENK